ncbi:MAG: SHOCT domain-containing protein [Thermomicrobiales bacterium]
MATTRLHGGLHYATLGFSGLYAILSLLSALGVFGVQSQRDSILDLVFGLVYIAGFIGVWIDNDSLSQAFDFVPIWGFFMMAREFPGQWGAIIVSGAIAAGILGIPSLLNYLRRKKARPVIAHTTLAGSSPPPEPHATATPAASEPESTPEQRLRTLKQMHASDLLTDAEYQERRARILADI